MDQTGQTKAQRRVLRACEACHQRKIRCSGTSPRCNNCSTTGQECLYGQESKKRGPPKGYMGAIELKLYRLEALLGGLVREGTLERRTLDDLIWGHGARQRREDGHGLWKDTAWSAWTAGIEAQGEKGPTEDGPDKRANMDAGREKDHGPAKPLESVKDKARGHMPDVLGQLSMDENRTLRYHGKASGLYMVAPSSTRFRDYTWQFPKPRHWPSSSQSRHLSEGEILESIQADRYLPDIRIQRHLLHLYFAHVHAVIPILDKRTFYQEFHSGDPLHKPSTTLLLAMLAFAAKYSSWRSIQARPGHFHTAGDAYYEAAKKCLDHDSENSRLSSVQAHLLLAMREQGTGRSTAAWNHSGAAVRMAQDLGLLRDSSNWAIPINQLTETEKDLRNRLFWACNIVEKNVSAWIGRPVAIFDRNYDASFIKTDHSSASEEFDDWRSVPAAGLEPEPVDILQALAFTSESPRTQSGSEEAGNDRVPWYRNPNYVEPADFVQRSELPARTGHYLSSFRAQSQLSEILGQILQYIYPVAGHASQMTNEVILACLESRLISWFLDLPEHLRYDLGSSQPPPPPHILTLHMTYYVAMILLHRPFIPAGREQSGIRFPSLQICISAANAIADIADTQSTVYRLRQCAPWLTYYIFTAAVIHVYVASTRTFGTHSHLIRRAKISLAKCMLSLKEMELPWTSAIRSWEVLLGLVDLRDVSMTELTEVGKSLKSHTLADVNTLTRNQSLKAGHRTKSLRSSRPRAPSSSSKRFASTKEILEKLQLGEMLRYHSPDEIDHLAGIDFVNDAISTSQRLQREHQVYGNTYSPCEDTSRRPERNPNMNPMHDMTNHMTLDFFGGLSRHSDVFAPPDYHLAHQLGSTTAEVPTAGLLYPSHGINMCSSPLTTSSSPHMTSPIVANYRQDAAAIPAVHSHHHGIAMILNPYDQGPRH